MLNYSEMFILSQDIFNNSYRLKQFKCLSSAQTKSCDHFYFPAALRNKQFFFRLFSDNIYI